VQDNVANMCANHPLLEELDLPHAHLRDKQAKLLLDSIKHLQMLRLVTLTDNYISEPVATMMGDELPHMLVVFDDIAEMEEVISLDGDELEDLEEGEDEGEEEGEESGTEDDSDGDDESGTEEETDSESDDGDSYSDSDSGTEINVSEQGEE
jgi:Ran GTPase-activating protein (RanGAP) involved in mRNA processing and transport